MNTSISIRMATVLDAENLLQIYSPYITDSAITFEYDTPSIEQFKQRIQETLKCYPYLVILQNNDICGFAYASTFKPRTAYNRAVETTIYLAQNYIGNGMGRQLYAALEAILKRQHIHNMYACITYASLPYANAASELFHLKLGFKKVAHFTNCGYKFNRWFDVIWMEKFIIEHRDDPSPFIPISSVNEEEIKQIISSSSANIN